MSEKWTCEKAWKWQGEKPWIVGCNFVPADCINAIEIWQEEGFDGVLRAAECEIRLAAEIGMNSVRMILPFHVWKYQRKGFLERLERMLAMLDGHGVTLVPIFFDDCGRGPVECYSEKVHFGRQPEPVKGCHGGYAPVKKMDSINPTYSYVDEPGNWPDMERFVRDVVSAHRTDERILMWDIWNEPGNSGGNGAGNVGKSMGIMEKVFAWTRQEDPVQPLTAGCWDFYGDYFRDGGCGEFTEIEKKALELSDVISWHYYGNYEKSCMLIGKLKEYRRPLFITEWLHRPFGNYVEEMLPLFKKEKIGCYNWGLVNGKTQTHEPWDWILDMDLDFGRWQHDLFYSDHTPYSEQEINLFKELTK